MMIELKRNKKKYDLNGLFTLVIDEYVKQKNYNLKASESTIDSFNNLKNQMMEIARAKQNTK